jgi:hypothetical protein
MGVPIIRRRPNGDSVAGCQTAVLVLALDAVPYPGEPLGENKAMIDYDSMGFDDLIVQLILNHVAAGGDFDVIKSALRKAVIREASVGTMDNRLKVINEHPLLVKKQVEILPDNLPLGFYDLTPKETP